MKLKGKVALVTGAAREIGRAHALRLARLGADVVINDINLESFKEYGQEITAPTVVEEVTALGVRSTGIVADVGKKEEVDKMVKQVLEGYGHVDILINNAGGIAGETFTSFASIAPEEDIRATIDRNLMGTVFCCQAVAEQMKSRGWGRIVNTASAAAILAQPGGIYAPYGMAKAGVISYTRSLAQELGPFGINVNCIAPYIVLTSRLAAGPYSMEGAREYLLSQIPLGRLGEPEDVAKVMEFFVTDLSDYVTGQVLSVCGGGIKF